MSNRITLKMLDSRLQFLNKVANSPSTYCDKVGDAPFKANIGHYFIGQQCGGVSLDRVSNESGGIDTIFYTTTKGELMRLINAFIYGLQAKQELVS